MKSEKFGERFRKLVTERFGGRYNSIKKDVPSFVHDFSDFVSKNSVSKDSEQHALENSVKKWAGGTVPRTNTLIQLASFFHVSVDYLLGIEEEENDYNEKFIHDYMGLEYKAIQRIKEYDDIVIDMLNRLLCYDVDLLRATLGYFWQYAVNYGSSSIKMENRYAHTETNYDYQDVNHLLESSCLLAISDVLYHVKNIYSDDREKIYENEMLLKNLHIEQLKIQMEMEKTEKPKQNT